MQKQLFAFAIAALLLFCSVTNSQFQTADAAAVDYYLKLGDIKGESKDDKHKEWIEIDSFSFGVSNSGTMASGGGGGAGKAKFAAISLVKPIDKSTPTLMLQCATGTHYPTAELVIVRSGAEVMKWTLSDVVISSYQINAEDAVPTDSFSINFAKIVAEYKSSGGPVIMGWDVKANKRV